MAIEAYKKDIVACNVLERVEEGFEKLQKLEQLLPPDDNLTRQFVVRSRALLPCTGGGSGRCWAGWMAATPIGSRWRCCWMLCG